MEEDKIIDNDIRLNLDIKEEDESVTVLEEKKNEALPADVETVSPEVEGTRCPDCPLKVGLKDDSTLCPTCNGQGVV